jgi:Flp pilus assembly protein TadG
MEMKLLHKDRRKRICRGQILVLFVISLPILILFVGIAIDFGFAFVTKTSLSKAVDAAALTGMRNINISGGTSKATQLALDAFNANYGNGKGLGRDVSPPVVNIAFTTSANNNPVVNVNATAKISTSFLSLLPGFNVLNVSSTAQVTRPTLIMSLVLDKSNSMNSNGGATALPGAVNTFLNNFDQSIDEIALISFSTLASTDVTIKTNYLQSITNVLNNMTFSGATFSQSALLAGQTQIASVSIPAGQQEAKVAVFFTDGWANTIQDTLQCGPSKSVIYGGCAPPEAQVGWCSGVSFLDPTTGNQVNCNATQFPAQGPPGGMEALTPDSTGQLNISNDAMYRAVQVAESMRAQGVTVFSIGMGDKINSTFLDQIANDKNSPTYNANEPIGDSVVATDSAGLSAAFQEIASEILLRISQ